MFENESDFKKLVDRLDIGTEPNVTHREKLRREMLSAFSQTSQPRPVERPPAAKWQTVVGTIMKSRIAKLAAAALIIVGLFFLFSHGQRSLYAQVLKALESARTMHVVGKSLRNGKWAKALEVWYDREQGVAETRWLSGRQIYTRIDNGKYGWRHEVGSRFAKRSESIDPRGIIRRLLDIRAFKEQAERDVNYDKTVNSVQYSAYVSSMGKTRIVTWLDGVNRVRGWEKSRLLDDGQWETYRIGEVEYDVEPEPNTFLPDFGADVKVVEVDTILDAYFGLDKAIVTKEALGSIFAVHEVRRCKGNIVYVVCSLRPTEQTRKQVPAYAQGPAVWSFGSFDLGASYERMGTSSGHSRSYQVVDLSLIYHGGLEVWSAILIPTGSCPERIEQCELEAYISVVGCELKKKRTAKGLPCKERFKPIAVVPLPPEGLGLGTILDEVYSTAKTLEAFVGYDKLILKSVPFTDKEMENWIREHPSDRRAQEYRSDKSLRLHHGGPTKPSEISKEDWIKDRMDYLREIENNYEEFLQEVKKREQQSR